MAKKNPSTRWFFRDWHNDEALQVCSLAARGAWIELLGICAENGGYLLINGKAPSIAALARYVGVAAAVMRRLLKELEVAGVFSRTDKGVIFNRRMVRKNGVIAELKTSKGTSREHGPKPAELLDSEHAPRARNAPARRKLSRAFKPSQDSTCNLNLLPSSPDAARAKGEEGSLDNEKGNPEGGRCAPLGVADAEPLEVLQANAGRVRAGTAKGESDACSSQAPTADYLDPALKCKCRSGGPAGTCDRSFDGQTSEVPVHHYPISRPAGQGRDNALNGEGQPETVGLPRRGRDCRPARAARPRPPPKSAALAAKIKEQLRQKHVRFLIARRRPEELAAYYAAVLDDDPAVGQRMFDDTDARMRRAQWDDMREWKAQRGIAVPA